MSKTENENHVKSGTGQSVVTTFLDWLRPSRICRRGEPCDFNQIKVKGYQMPSESYRGVADSVVVTIHQCVRCGKRERKDSDEVIKRSDAVPRDIDGRLQTDKTNPNYKMYLWLSGPPLTEFRDGRKIKPETWVEFTQDDEHRGTVSDSNQWRLFIRLMPRALVARERKGPKCLRRHSQVYLDAERFTW